MNVLKFDLRALAFKDNPFPELARLREAGPVVRLKLPVVGAVWAATTYDAVSELLRDHATFVQEPAHAGRPCGRSLRTMLWQRRPGPTDRVGQ